MKGLVIFIMRIVGGGVFQQVIGICGDDPDGIIDFMRHSCCHLSEGGELFGAEQALPDFHQLHLLIVDHFHDEPGHEADHPDQGEFQGKSAAFEKIERGFAKPDGEDKESGDKEAHENGFPRAPEQGKAPQNHEEIENIKIRLHIASVKPGRIQIYQERDENNVNKVGDITKELDLLRRHAAGIKKITLRNVEHHIEKKEEKDLRRRQGEIGAPEPDNQADNENGPFQGDDGPTFNPREPLEIFLVFPGKRIHLSPCSCLQVKNRSCSFFNS